MKQQATIIHKSFKYSYDRKRATNVDFDITEENGKKVAKNIELISNWRAHYPQNPEIGKNARGEYVFIEKGCWTTNGDMQQIIKRILRMVDETEG